MGATLALKKENGKPQCRERHGNQRSVEITYPVPQQLTENKSSRKRKRNCCFVLFFVLIFFLGIFLAT
jgi:hypothetical protein